MKPLSDKEVDIVFKWLGVRLSLLSPGPSLTSTLQFLVNFFHAQGEGVPLEDLRNTKYRGAFFASPSLSILTFPVQNLSRPVCTTIGSPTSSWRRPFAQVSSSSHFSCVRSDLSPLQCNASFSARATPS